MRKWSELKDWKRSVFIPIPKKDNAKECLNYHTIVLTSHASNILQARRQQYVNWELSDVQAGFTKGRGTRDQIASICWIIEKARESRKTPTSASLSMLKTLKEMGIPDHLTCLLKTCMCIKKPQLELDMGQQTGSKLGKEYVKAVYCYPVYLTHMQSTSYKMQAGWITSWNQEYQGKYQQPQICRQYNSNGRKWRGNEDPLDESERGEWEKLA